MDFKPMRSAATYDRDGPGIDRKSMLDVKTYYPSFFDRYVERLYLSKVLG
jgi:hypothetical protein